MNRDLKNNIAKVMLTEPADHDYTDFFSNILDTQGFEGAELVAIIGTLTGVDVSNTLTITAEECDTTVTGSFTTVAAADLEGAFTLIDASTEDQVIQSVGYYGTKRYIRLKFNYAGTGISASIVSAIGLLSNPRVSPAVAPAAVSAT
jgi:hypothetical protein